MSARSIYDQFTNTENDGRWQILQKWVTDKEGESLHLEFKIADGKQGEPGKSDIKNLAKELSAFANTEGGVLVFGIDTGKGDEGEYAKEIAAVPFVEKFAKRIDEFSRDRTDPPIPGIAYFVVKDPSDTTRGAVVILVPESAGGPHRAINASVEVNDKYFARSRSSSEVMSHRHLGALFSSRPTPVLRLAVEPLGRHRLRISVLNVGRGVARSAHVRFGFASSVAIRIRWSVEGVGDFSSALRTGLPFDKYTYSVLMNNLLYPDDGAVAAIVRFMPPAEEDGDEAPDDYNPVGVFSARIDAEDMQPVIVSETIESIIAVDDRMIFPIDDGT